ncbi:glycerophosphodiester phosphodiesterase family protein [Pediococcus pentosaceus]|uniref:glycerophosphodiester phosphodiesterase family protein n=1 Tax=Pediococcus pentosaceus TaxID=1255 RepID=UPI0013281ECB|nr:glycerophosphodiester phosphodiesterase family protein [Pediococcus pentosaceus]KAF0524185.1 DUF2479 domain-containing protein [Pediococcus pentosaceus]
MANGPLIIDLMHPMDVVLQFPTIGRVRDSNVDIPLWIKYDGKPYDLTSHSLGFYGRDAKGVAKIALQDPIGPAIEAGRVTFRMPGAAFKVAGQYEEAWFRVEKDGQLVSSLNVKFNVLENNVEFGVDDEPYYSDIEKLIAEFKKAITNSENDALKIIAEYKQKFQSIVDNSTWLMSQLDIIEAKIKSNDIATNSQLKQAVADLSTELMTEISKRPTNQDVVDMVERGFANFDGGNPHTIADEVTLNSQYPNGTSGIWVTQDNGHKFFWNANTSKWVDGGAYQAVELNDDSVEINKLAPNATNATVLLDAQGYPDYDDRTHVFDFNSGEQQAAILWGQGQSYRIPSGTKVKNTEVDNYTSVRLLFNTETKTFSTKPWNTKIGKNEIIILTLRDRWSSEIKNTSVSANFPVTINGHLQTSKSSILPSMLSENNATGVYVSPAAMKLPDYDLTNHVLNFNSKVSDLDTTATVGYNGKRYAIPANTKVENKVFNETSNAMLVFSPSTKKFNFIKWNDDVPEDSVPLGMLRELSGIATNQATKASFSGAFTMTFNGKYANQLGNDNDSMATIIQSDRFAPDYDDRTHTFRFNSQRRTSTNDGYEPKVILTYNGNQYTLDSDVTVVNTLAVNRQTSVQKLVFNVSTKDFSFVRNDTPTAYNQWIVAIVRDDNSLEQNTLFNTTVIAEFPVTVNGLPQGQTINEKEANMIGILHRGAMDYAPEESLPAYKMARQIGFNHVEGDVHFTKDNIPVMIHDDTINRTAFNLDGSLLSQDVAVVEHTLDELNQYSYAMIHNKFRSEYKDTKLCTFEDMVKIGKAYNYHLHVELKIEMTKEQVQTLVDIAAKYGMLDNIGWQAFTHEWLKPLQEIYPKATLELLTEDNPTNELLAEMKNYQNGSNYVIGSFSSKVTPDGMVDFAKAGIGLYVWTLYSNKAVQSWLGTPVNGVMVQGEVNPAKAMMFKY